MNTVAKPKHKLAGLSTDQPRSLLDELDRAFPKGYDLQKRRTPRLPFRSIDARIELLDEQPGSGIRSAVATRNLSLQGIAFLHDCPLSVGQMLRIEITFRKDYVMQMEGRVVRCRQVRGGLHEVGVEFTPR